MTASRSTGKTARKSTNKKKTGSAGNAPQSVQTDWGGILRDFLKTRAEAISIWDPEDRLIAYNDKFEEIFSAFPDIRLGKTIGEFFLDFANTGAIKEIAGKEKEWVAEKLAEREAEIGKEITYQTHDNRWISRLDHRLPNGGIVGIRKDVTDIKARDDRLDRYSEQIELGTAAFNSLSTAVLVRDKELRYRLVNKRFEELYGKAAKDVIGKTAVELFGAEAAAGFDPDNLEVIKTGKGYSADENLKFPDGRQIRCRTEVKPLRGANGETYAGITITDITDLFERENALVEKTSELAIISAAMGDMSVAVLVKDKNNRYRFVNDEFAAILGFPPEQVIGKTTAEIWGKEVAEDFERREQKVFETGEKIEFEEDYVGRDGAGVSCITSITRIEDSQGEHYVCIVAKDVSEIKKRENKLEQQAFEIEQHRRRMQQFAEISADWFWETDQDLKFTFFSEGLKNSLGFEPDQLIGKTRKDLWAEQELGDDKRQHLETLDAHPEFKDFTYEITAPDGKIHSIAISGAPNFDRDGNFSGYMGSGRNVSDQIESRKKLDAASELIREATSAMAQGLMVLGLDEIVMISQKARDLLELPDEIGEGSSLETYFSFLSDRGDYGDDNKEAEERVAKSLRDIRDNQVHQVQRYSPSGKALQIDAVPRRGGGAVVTISDVTDQKAHEEALLEAREQARKADHAKSEFLANMSHEIRTPMNGVMGMAELLVKTDLNAKQKMFTDVIVKSGASLLTIINDILDFSKLDAGQMELDPAPFKLAEAIEDVATLVSSRVVEKDLELIVRVDPALPQMFIGDVGRIRQIVTNLLGNAVKFTEKGHVYVNVSEQPRCLTNNNRRLRFEVEDTGIGIPAEKCETVFEKFSQVDTSSSRKHEGTGLGLTIASSLVKIMGGEFGVRSEVGLGSVFWFEIELPADAESRKEKRVPVDVSGARVLVVDDNNVNRSILSEQMTAWQFDSAACVDGFEALAVMRAAAQQGINIDCVVLDYHMPGMNGGDVVKKMRSEDALKNIPVIMLTSVDQTEDGKTFSTLGIQGHLTKPARSSHLLETIISILNDNEYRDVSDAVTKPVAETNVSADADLSVDEIDEIETYHDNSAIKMDEVPFDHDLEYAVSGQADTELVERVDVLVCEDNEVNQIVFTQILQNAGLTFRIAPNGKRGVEMMREWSPTIILMDVSMPEMNGLQATEAIRNIEKDTGKHTPIIGVTAHAIKGDMEKCIEAGMDDYLSKPVSPDRLQEKISAWMNSIRDVRKA